MMMYLIEVNHPIRLDIRYHVVWRGQIKKMKMISNDQ